MCGIFGTITENGLDRGAIERVMESMRHRGPDDSGHSRFDLDKRRVLDLVHTRLSIIDLSPEAAQPMSYDGGNLWIAYNGEIFNYKEIRSRLKLKGYSFRTQSDTEVILAAYSEWGGSCVDWFNGDWAFCIYDRPNKKLFLSRDRLGVKPLYYRSVGKNFVFSSEINPLFGMPFVKREWDHDTLGTFFLIGASDFSSATMFKGISQIDPATCMTMDLDSGEIASRRYWRPSFNRSYEKFDAAKEKKHKRNVRDLFEDAVRMRLRSDVPVGTCLSGGIDSSAVTAIINVLLKKNCPDAASVGPAQKTFNASYPGESMDESEWARLVNETTGARGEFIEPGSNDLKADLDDFLLTHHELCRSTSIYAQYKVMQLASRHVKVVLDGQGADELFGGYAHYGMRAQKFGLSIAPKWLLSLKYRSKGEVLGEILKHRVDIRSAMGMLKRKYPFDFNEALYGDETRYNLQQLLRYEDRNSMRFSVEARVPFTDHRLVEYVLDIPACYKIHDGWTKYILRKAVEDILPPEVVWRRDKIGFETPETKWLQKIDEFKYFIGKFGVKGYDGDYFWWRAFNFSKINGII
jgi:asparagine synthase (glutamine-hydrolysing)